MDTINHNPSISMPLVHEILFSGKERRTMQTARLIRNRFRDLGDRAPSRVRSLAAPER
jgi:hypothetical protein